MSEKDVRGLSQRRRNVLKSMGAAGSIGALAGCSGLFGDGNGIGNGNNQDQGMVDPEDLPEEEVVIAGAGPESLFFHPHRVAQAFKDFMEHTTDGKFKVEFQRGIGTWPEMIEQVSTGSIEMIGGGSEGEHGVFDSNLSAWNVPFLFPDLSVANHVMDHDYGHRLNQNHLEKTGMRMLGWYENGGFRIFAFNQEVTSLDDFEGLQIRVQGGSVAEKVVSELGAEPVAIDHTELYEALDQGTVDGMDMSLVLIAPNNYHEVQSHILMTHHVYSRSQLVCNNEWFEDLHPTYQTLVSQAGIYAGWDTRRMQSVLRPRSRQQLEDAGMEIIEPSQDLVDTMRDTVQEPATDFLRDKADDPKWVDDIFDAAEVSKEYMGF